MTRAEQAALKAYPEKMGMFHEADIHYEADLNKAARIKYIEGYEQAEEQIFPVVKSLVDTLEDYMLCKCTRSVLVNKKNELKELIEDRKG